MFKILLHSFSMCRYKLYQILSISKNVPCFVLLITGYFKFYTKQDKTTQVLKFSNSKVHHIKFIRGRCAKSMLAIIPGALLSQKFYFFFSFFVLHFSAVYNEISGMLLS